MLYADTLCFYTFEFILELENDHGKSLKLEYQCFLQYPESS